MDLHQGQNLCVESPGISQLVYKFQHVKNCLFLWFTKNNKNSDESKSSTSSESFQSFEKPKNKNNLINLLYHVVTESPNYPNIGLYEISSGPVKNKQNQKSPIQLCQRVFTLSLLLLKL